MMNIPPSAPLEWTVFRGSWKTYNMHASLGSRTVGGHSIAQPGSKQLGLASDDLMWDQPVIYGQTRRRVGLKSEWEEAEG